MSFFKPKSKITLLFANLCLLISLLLVGVTAHATSAAQVYLVRHFEKQTSDTHLKDPDLTVEGSARAQALARFVSDKNISLIFSTDYKRTKQTAAPSAESLKLQVTLYNPSNLEAFAAQLTALSNQHSGNILVVGHSNTTPQLLALLGGPQRVLSETDYGDLFMLSLSADKTIAAESFEHIIIESSGNDRN